RAPSPRQGARWTATGSATSSNPSRRLRSVRTSEASPASTTRTPMTPGSSTTPITSATTSRISRSSPSTSAPSATLPGPTRLRSGLYERPRVHPLLPEVQYGRGGADDLRVHPAGRSPDGSRWAAGLDDLVIHSEQRHAADESG